MIIKELTIYNFRSYYGTKKFVFSDHLNLILGSNGDGKTTFFDAINWVLTPDYIPKTEEDRMPEDSSLVSAKMFSELGVGQSGRVLVSMKLKNNSGSQRIIERAFNVSKTSDGKMRIDGRTHKAYQIVGSIRKEMFSVKDVFEKENAFPAIIKKYHIFKGEDRLNIFNDKTTLQTLIDMFSEIKDLEPFKQFAKYAKCTSEKAFSGSKDKANKQNAKIVEIQNDITELSKRLETAESELVTAKRNFNEAKEHIDAIDNDYEIIQEVDKLEKEVYKTESEIERLSDKIDEEYSFKLLDEQWILMGFGSILREFNNKLESLAFSKNNIESDYRKKQEEEFKQAKIEKAKTELEKIAWNRTDVEKMKQMLVTHRCAYCGSAAPEGSVTYDFIRQRISDVIDLLTPKPEEKRPEIKRYFYARNIEELKEIGLSLAHTGKDFSSIPDEIESTYHENDEIRKLIAQRKKQVDALQKNIADLYASSSSGENLKEYVANIAVVNRWRDQKEASAIAMNKLLTSTIPNLKEQLKKKREDQKKNVKTSGGNSMMMVNEFFNLFSDAIDNTEAATYEEFLSRLAKEANVFLAHLNVDDFTGVIKIYLDRYNDLKIELQDKNGKLITNPNTSLLTTMHISILFAISELTKENRDAEYPLIFDAPTSSFDEGKDKTFYECLNTQVNKQCIVVTKSFLYKDDNGEYVTDTKALGKLNCQKYRIKKLTGFDKLDITTIDTIVEEIKEE